MTHSTVFRTLAGARAIAALSLLCGALVLAAAATGNAADRCQECHDPNSIGEGTRSVHSPFGSGECTACHLDHGDEERLILTKAGNSLCGQCHDFGDDSFFKAHGRIRGGKVSCLSCHDPHRSESSSLLRPGRHRPLLFGRCNPCHRFDGRMHQPTVRELCLSCHDREEFSRPYGHSPVTKGDCLACHDPHGSRRQSLLVDDYTLERKLTGGEDDYTLCLGCHRKEIFTAPGTEKTTAFRRGETNIHRLHIAGQTDTGRAATSRKIACRNCHEVHTSRWPKLIRESLDCGGVPCLKLEFRERSDGGECSVSCHGTVTYSRDGSAPAAPPIATLNPRPAPTPTPTPTITPTNLEKSIDRKCLSCHQREVEGFSQRYVHFPVRKGNCSACHLDHGSDNRLVLLDREDRLCARCHNLQSNDSRAAHRDYSLRQSKCTECHDPHASGRKKLLYAFEHEPFAERDCAACHAPARQGWEIGDDVSRVCTECHDDITGSPHLHSALPRRGCTGCHQPHLSEREHFLRAGEPELCFRCHESRGFRRQTVHPPVAEGECSACHPPHGSDRPGLFTLPYPLERYLDFREESYALCWKCHDENLSPAAETGFRDGERSLHTLHVTDRRKETELGERVLPGITCRNCHNPHSTDNPLLILKHLDCDGVPCLQLEYHKVGEGGRCLGGCHTRESYLPLP